MGQVIRRLVDLQLPRGQSAFLCGPRRVGKSFWIRHQLPPWQHAQRRRLIGTEKFYLFDVGVANFLARRTPQAGSPEFGKSIEHLVLLELRAWQAYRSPDTPLAFCRTSSGLEVDVIVGDLDLAVEAGTRCVAPRLPLVIWGIGQWPRSPHVKQKPDSAHSSSVSRAVKRL